MNINISIHKEDPYLPDAETLLEELSNILETLTGSSGKASFNIEDVITAEMKRVYARKPGMGIGSKIISYLENESQKLG